ncbi:PaaI family thioesterase [Blastococcus sp. CT_GayMR20]|uniref:PaaI family thioesterase n=1 Tax=Blastococcus sp. CT_GayMR20 TaxID=2559609 RepID=UPI0010746F72|nr:hotdog domain-containing protein [Blastococcus sp. CT_GayMR20]TFV91960.1 PaaI family thioesterase [Blastococcus sp. CT_GayMR20]TFV91963.1 PaaI family thioesterase [Blastococcus sp. CT_GayMR20]
MTKDDSGTIPDTEPLAAAADLATALRELIEVSVTTTVPAGEVRAAAELVRQVTERLAAARRPASQLSALDDVRTGRRVFNPVTGVGSALAPPLVLRRSGDGVAGEAVLGVAYEGPPSYVHGGMSALLMDQVLGDTAAAAGVWGMTAHLELDYRGPLPVGEPLVFRGSVAESDGRKSLIVGTVALAAAPDQPLVEARGLFVTPRREKLEAYFGAITDGSGGEGPTSMASDATALGED